MGKLIDDLYSERGVGMSEVPALIEEFKAALAEKEKQWATQLEQVIERLGEDHRYHLAEKDTEIARLKQSLGVHEVAGLEEIARTQVLYQRIDRLQTDLDRVMGEAVWAMRLILQDNPEGCLAWCNATEFLNSPIVQSWRARQATQTQGGARMTEWKQYKRKGLSEMRPYVPGEDLSGISVNKEDTPELGGMVARNPDNHADQWYVAKAYFEKNLEPA